MQIQQKMEIPKRGDALRRAQGLQPACDFRQISACKDPISSSFVKNQIEYLKNYFEQSYVIALYPWVPKFMSHFEFMDSKGRNDGYAQDYKYDNVEVYFAKPLALPFEFSRRRGDDSFRAAIKVIKKNKIDFDLIHAHFTLPSGYVGARLKDVYEGRIDPYGSRGSRQDLGKIIFSL